MPANTTLKSAIKDIADAIRVKGVTGTMSLNQMPTKIASIPSGSQTKYGVDIDGMIGDLDNNGVLQLPTSQNTFAFHSSDIVSIDGDKFTNKFRYSYITSLDLPNLTTCGEGSLSYMCHNCPVLAIVNIPKLTGSPALTYSFYNCPNLRTVNLNKLSDAGGLIYTFYGCSSLEVVDFSEAVDVIGISQYTFGNTNETFKVVVPDALYDRWISESGWWRDLSSHVIAKSDYDA